MIVDHRTYTVAPRKMGEFLRLFEQYGLPIQTRHLGPPLGYYITEVGPLNQVVHLWGYDSMADMERRRTARSADPEWAAYLERTAGMVIKQQTMLIRPAPFFKPR